MTTTHAAAARDVDLFLSLIYPADYLHTWPNFRSFGPFLSLALAVVLN